MAAKKLKIEDIEITSGKWYGKRVSWPTAEGTEVKYFKTLEAAEEWRDYLLGTPTVKEKN